MKKADKLLKNGIFLTMESLDARAEAVAIRGDRILFVGSEKDAEQYVDEDTEIMDLGGRVASPGLIDCHTHATGGFTTMFVYLNFSKENTTSLKRVLDMVREKAKTTPKGEWIVGRCYDESKFEEGPILINRDMLDEITTDHPVYLIRTCGHIAVLNSLAMSLSGFTEDRENPPSGGHFFRDENGRMTGMISGSVLSKVASPGITGAQRKEAMISGVQADYFSKGITSTAEMGSSPVILRFLQKLDLEGKLKLRIGFYFSGRRNPPNTPMTKRVQDMGFVSGFGSDHVRFLGMKYVMDGSTGGRTAAFSKPYVGEPDNFGELYNNPEFLKEDVLRSARAGFQISIHAIGDRAIEGALESIEYAVSQGVDTRPLRWRMEHVESPTPDQIRRMKELGISVGLSSAFIYSLGDSHLNVLGYDRVVEAFPAKSLLAEGIHVGCNSDCPICDVNPMLGIYSMVNRITEKGRDFGGKKEAVSRLEALEAYTRHPSFLVCNEKNVGTLTPSKFADITVFDGDFLSVPDEELKNMKIYMTLSGGEVVYQRG